MSKFNAHHDTVDRKDEWLTPKALVDALGVFDLDPCAPIVRPWPTAKQHFTEQDNGLIQPWFGRVWLNPPYDRRTLRLWLAKMAEHNNGIALLFARTEIKAFHSYVYPVAHSLFFFEGRVKFHHVSGDAATWTGGAPSCLIAYGDLNTAYIRHSKLKGRLVLL